MSEEEQIEAYREAFKQAFREWAIRNPDPNCVHQMPQHLEVFKSLLPAQILHSAILELQCVNATIEAFQGAAKLHSSLSCNEQTVSQIAQVFIDDADGSNVLEFPIQSR